MINFTDSDPTTNPLNDWLLNYGIYIAIALAGIAFIVVLTLFIISMVKRKKEMSGESFHISPSEKSESILLALGGIDNIVEHSMIGSRMSLVLKNYDLVNETRLNELGVNSIIKMSNKIILVIKDDLSKIYNGMFNR